MSAHNGDQNMQAITPEQLTAHALGQLEGDERAAVEHAVAGCDGARHELREVESLAAAITAVRRTEPLVDSSPRLRAAIERQLADAAAKSDSGKVAVAARQPAGRRRTWLVLALGSVACGLLAMLLLPAVQSSRDASRRAQAANNLRQLALAIQSEEAAQQQALSDLERRADEASLLVVDGSGSMGNASVQPGYRTLNDIRSTERAIYDPTHQAEADAIAMEMQRTNESLHLSPKVPGEVPSGYPSAEIRFGHIRDSYGAMEAQDAAGSTPSVSALGLDAHNTLSGDRAIVRLHKHQQPDVNLWNGQTIHDERLGGLRAEITRRTATDGESLRLAATPRIIIQEEERERALELGGMAPGGMGDGGYYPGTEQYAPISENAFVSPLDQPLSTFGIDVDTASYSNMRRFLTQRRLPPPDAVRIEELVNYFRYDYPQPKGDQPFSVNMEVAQCPWREGHLLLRVGLKGKDVHRAERPESHLVFLLDVSGSMSDANKLPLVKTAMRMLVQELGENDRVSIVTYAGDAGLRLPPTRGHEQDKILGVIDSLSAGGSTHGSAGIQLAYEQAAAYFVEGGTNRVILCTDGDLNVGVTDDEALVKMIKEKAAGGTFLTVLGFGMGNLKDAKMERLANNGNGMYAYIDSVREARKVLVEQLTGSTITIAKDVKVQIEFNPQEIAGYRLIGYENRLLAAEDFADDKKDAGEIGAGHTVTALYELVPVGAAADATKPRTEGVPLKYQEPGARGQEPGDSGRPTPDSRPPTPDSRLTDAARSGELLTLKLRYKEPDGDVSKLLEHPLKERGGSFNAASRDMQFATAVAGFGMILRGSEHRGSGNLAAIAEIAAGSLGDDPGGYRAEFVDLVRQAQALGAK